MNDKDTRTERFIATLGAEFVDVFVEQVKQLSKDSPELVEQLEHGARTDLRKHADSELSFLVNNSEELYNLRNNPRALMAILADDYEFTWWQVSTLIYDLKLEDME